MKIENLRLERRNNRARVAATVSWEDSGGPTQELYFETGEEFAQDLSSNPHAFLVACVVPAMHYGEERVFIDAEICPELRDGLMTAMAWIRHWYDWYRPDRRLVRIEAKTQHHVPQPNKPHRAGFFFSGGVDSLATLRANRLNYSPEHPGFIKDGLLVYGLEVYEPKAYEHVVSSVSVIAKDAGIRLIPVYTNIRYLGPVDDRHFWLDFWLNEFMGATFSAIAHAFTKRLSVVSINSCHDIPNIIPYGSHPLLNANYSSSDLKIRHEGITLSRFEKTKLVADWDVALQHLRVCNRIEHYRPGMLNCGKCEKCVRTMLALLALGKLEQSRAFPIHELTEELLEAAIQLGYSTVPLYEELIPPLMKKGRHDLARVIERKIAFYHIPQWKKKWRRRRRKIIGPIAEFDRIYLNDALKRLKKFSMS